ncbi:helix-turn-helix transcriptional regulator [Leisingera sp. M523]|uniref:helix-turn-helix transcriptional regulator n=1 Tax=Leisingera sp. M523 TaxID=2867013 RepID=UPI0021A83FB7|nr:helix-turn-helix transcriptional regulator [Leisingera sp. M523]UWQ27753.1 helix-turn-helix transcriptional regulator [Leisingera sp. M523]
MFDARTMMQSSNRTGESGCLAGLARAIKLAGQDGFLAALADLCQSASGYDSTFIAAFFPDHPPMELFDNLSDEYSAATIKPYLDFAYFLDPFYNLFQQGIGDRVVTLGECAPDDFMSSEYYQTFYADTGLFDETSVFVAFGSGAAAVISLGSREEGFQFGPDQRAALAGLLPCIAALCRRHWPALDPNSLAGSGRMGLHLKKSFDRFATSMLSGREVEIVQLILKGHSSKSIARELGNSPETVKVHRKRIHNKLGITSQGELFSLFLEALTRAPANATGDPLSYLDRPVSGQL